MTSDELRKLLAKVAVFDNRRVDAATLLAWNEVLGDITYAEADSALIAARQTMRPETYLMPAHITRIVMERRDRFHMRNDGRDRRSLTWSHNEGRYIERPNLRLVSRAVPTPITDGGKA